MIDRASEPNRPAAMVCSADDLLEWKDFPKGLRVLLLDEDSHSAAEIKLKLEEMDYIVSTFHNEDEAFKAISNKCESFHVAIVEVSTGNSLGSFKFLENAKDLPTIMTSNIHCLSTMMKCIAHGAAEFLQKPLSEEKLRNIWQHVVHKAFNAAGELDGLSKAVVLPPAVNKETVVVSMLHLKVAENNISSTNKMLETDVDIDHEANFGYDDDHEYYSKSTTNDRFPAPSTPQLKQAGGNRLLDDGDCQETSTQDQLPNNKYSSSSTSMEMMIKEGAGGDEAADHGRSREYSSKSVDTTTTTTTCNNISVHHPQLVTTTTTTTESSLPAGGPKTSTTTTESNFSSQLKTKDAGVNAESGNYRKKASNLHPNSCGSRANSRKKMKVDWTSDLHKQFVQAVEQLGVDQAIPSRILELMKVEGLTRHNVASHLQKYRLNRRHILPKEDHHHHHHHQDRINRWQSSSSMQRTTTNYHQQHHNKPIMAYPSLPLPYHQYQYPSAHHHHHQQQAVYHVWGHPAAASNHQVWGHHSGFPAAAWQHPDSRIWKGITTTAYPATATAAAAGVHQMNVDGWGCPVNVIMPTLSQLVPCTTYPQVQNVTGYQCLDAVEDRSSMGNMGSFHLHPQDGDVDAHDDDDDEKAIFIDKIVKEAMSKPWLPLPLGLNPPSTESVLSELQRQGITNIPPPKHHHHHY